MFKTNIMENINFDYNLEDFEFERKKVYLETGSLTACTILDKGISLGFKKAQCINEKKFTLDDVSKMYYDMIRSTTEGTLRKWKEDDFKSYIISLNIL